ncbi:hypothetical protein FSOLCH5_008402 [Fusarium solani]
MEETLQKTTTANDALVRVDDADKTAKELKVFTDRQFEEDAHQPSYLISRELGASATITKKTAKELKAATDNRF